ncbi:hypothetical protein QBC47DRAFT_376979 [Echria macrotheca]|uniref:Uncharacterized protein n=1 Tax=Echria macrotheca TaxID=438768 RepID=A0AAJ0BIK9_9PEZI|nr:hypothetical protein QBC47DRAFT_376979 [Echria macrotheca]
MIRTPHLEWGVFLSGCDRASDVTPRVRSAPLLIQFADCNPSTSQHHENERHLAAFWFYTARDGTLLKLFIFSAACAVPITLQLFSTPVTTRMIGFNRSSTPSPALSNRITTRPIVPGRDGRPGARPGPSSFFNNASFYCGHVRIYSSSAIVCTCFKQRKCASKLYGARPLAWIHISGRIPSPVHRHCGCRQERSRQLPGDLLPATEAPLPLGSDVCLPDSPVQAAVSGVYIYGCALELGMAPC